MPEETLDTLRVSIARLLPAAMSRAVDSYEDFICSAPEADAKKFREHHMAGRAALQHLDALLDLAKWATVEDARNMPQERLGVLAAEASAALARLRQGDRAGRRAESGDGEEEDGAEA